ncbi:MAG: DUF2079 domain-containing protein [Thermoplasmatales archaeon]
MYGKEESVIMRGKDFISAHIFELILFISIAIYIIYWSELSFYRVVTFQAAVFDLGMFAQGMYLAFHSDPYGIFLMFINRDPSVIFSPLTVFHSYELIVIVQTIFLGIPAFLIYEIAKSVTKNNTVSFIFSIIYLIFPMLYGVQWFDVHNQAFFIFFFLLAFYLFLRENYIVSTVLFLVAGMAHYLFLVFPILFSISVLSYSLRQHGHRNIKDRETLWSLIILTSSLSFLFISYHINSGTVSSILSISHAQNFSLSYPHDRLVTLFIAVAPLGFLPLIPNRFSILMLPFILLTFLSTLYIYPQILLYQYSAQVVPGLFISAIYSYSFVISKLSGLKETKHKFWKKIHITPKKVSKIVYGIMFVSAIYLVFEFAPYSPNNSFTGLYETSQQVDHYSTLFSEFEKVASLIPKNDPYVVIDNSEPELLPRPQIPGAPILETPYTLTYNLTYHNLNNSGYSKPYIQYVIGNPYGRGFTQAENPPYNLSMFDLLNRLYNSGQYGIVAEASGIILLENNYTGPLKYFVPLSLNLSPSYLNAPYIQGYVPYYGVNMIYSLRTPLIVDQSRTLNGPMFLPPGYYSVTLNLTIVHFSGSHSKIGFQFLESDGNILNESQQQLSRIGGDHISLSFYLSSMQEYTYIRLSISNAFAIVQDLRVEQKNVSYENYILKELAVHTDREHIPYGETVELLVNISDVDSMLDNNFCNILFALPNSKLVDAFIGGYNSSTNILSVYIKDTGTLNNLRMLVMKKEFNALELNGPIQVAPWVYYSPKYLPVGSRVFSYYSEFYSTPLSSAYIDTINQTIRGNYVINEGLTEFTNDGQAIILLH